MCKCFTVPSPFFPPCTEWTVNAKGHTIQSPSYRLLHCTALVAVDNPYLAGPHSWRFQKYVCSCYKVDLQKNTCRSFMKVVLCALALELILSDVPTRSRSIALFAGQMCPPLRQTNESNALRGEQQHWPIWPRHDRFSFTAFCKINNFILRAWSEPFRLSIIPAISGS